MKRYILLFTLLALISLQFSNAQRGRMQNRMEQINAEKIAFFTERMSLTPEEAKEFWPVYDDLSSRREKIFNERRNLGSYYRSNRESLKAKEIEQLADKLVELQVQEAKLAEEFHKKFKAVLPAEKVLIFYQSEGEFRNYLLRRLSGGGRGQGPANRERLD
jgi:tRNA isopentenyl-2-thiomethyl-A-37 hydroxylase MiaE